MDVERIRALYEFNRWASAAVLEARLVKILVGPLSAHHRIPVYDGLCHERSIALGTPSGFCDGPG